MNTPLQTRKAFGEIADNGGNFHEENSSGEEEEEEEEEGIEYLDEVQDGSCINVYQPAAATCEVLDSGLTTLFTFFHAITDLDSIRCLFSE